MFNCSFFFGLAKETDLPDYANDFCYKQCMDENKFKALEEFGDNISIPTEVNAILNIITTQIKAGKSLEDLFSYNDDRKTWKLQRKYLLSAEALEQRRQAAKRPKRKNDPLKNISGNSYKRLLARCSILKKSIDRFCDELQHAKELAIKKRKGGSI